MTAHVTPRPGYQPAQRTLAVAAFAQRYLPRGKGAVPRMLGRAAGRRPRYLVTRHGARLVLARGAWDVYATMALNGNSWDYHDFGWCLNGLCPDELTGPAIFYDIGANVGYFSIEMAARLGDAVRVVAVEPQPALAAAITASARLNQMSNVQVIAAMAGDRAGAADLYLAPASIHASAVPDSGRHPVGTATAPMVTIDGLVGAGTIPPPDLVKLDVEGSEHLVLAGAEATLRAHQPHVFCEYIAACDPGGRVRRQLSALLADCQDLELFGHAAIGVPSGRPCAWFRIETTADWDLVDSVFLRSRIRAVRDESVFQPCAP